MGSSETEAYRKDMEEAAFWVGEWKALRAMSRRAEKEGRDGDAERISRLAGEAEARAKALHEKCAEFAKEQRRLHGTDWRRIAAEEEKG